MKNLKYILLLILVFGVFSCAKKTFFPDSTAMGAHPIESRILKFELMGIADTTSAFIRGNISGRYIHQNDTLTEKLEFANFSAFDKNTYVTIGDVSDVNGNFILVLDAATYRFEIQFVGYNKLILDNVRIGTGEIYELNSLLGQGIYKTKYELRDNGTIVKLD